MLLQDLVMLIEELLKRLHLLSLGLTVFFESCQLLLAYILVLGERLLKHEKLVIDPCILLAAHIQMIVHLIHLGLQRLPQGLLGLVGRIEVGPKLFHAVTRLHGACHRGLHRSHLPKLLRLQTDCPLVELQVASMVGTFALLDFVLHFIIMKHV